MKEKTKIVTKVLSVALSVMIAFGAGFLASYTVMNPAPGDRELTVPADDHGALIQSGESHGVRLTAARLNTVSAQSDECYLLTATLTPSTSVCPVDWSVAWKDPSDSFATGKSASDYVTITPTSDGALTANATYLKDFASQILIKASARTDSTVYATCTVDCVSKRTWVEFEITSSKYPEINVQFNPYDEDETVELILPTGNAQTQFLVAGESDYTVTHKAVSSWYYTVLDSVKSYQISMRPSPQFLTAAQQVGLTCSLSAQTYVDLESQNDINYHEIIARLTDGQAFQNRFDENVYAKFVAACAKSTSYDFELQIKTVCESGRTFTYALTCHFAHSNFTFAESISLNPDNILF